jgi:hypothetical protein
MKYLAALLAFAVCAGCGAPTVAPSAAALNPTYVASLPNLPRYATNVPDWQPTVPDRHYNSKTFEYIINDYGTYASIFDYPKSDKQIGSIKGVGGQGCTNVPYGFGKKFFWIVSGADQIEEFEVPKKPIKTLSYPASLGEPSSCAMNAEGDLAVGILYGSGSASGGGDIVIFKHARGPGVVMTTPLRGEYFDGYDNHGNLFADGLSNSRDAFGLVELPKGSSTFETITTSNSGIFPGSVQWDGKYLTVDNQDGAAIYRYTVRGTKATLKGTVPLTGSKDCAQTWIAQGVVYCADAFNGDGEVYNYPAGGTAIAVLQGNFDIPLGTVSAER